MKSKDVDRRSIWLLAKEYLSSPYVTFECVGASHDISGRMASNILWRGIAENILSTTVSEAIFAKVVRTSYRGKARNANHWEDAFEKRMEVREKINKKLKMLRAWDQLLVNRLENYDEYVALVETPYSKEELTERLEKVRNAISTYVTSLR